MIKKVDRSKLFTFFNLIPSVNAEEKKPKCSKEETEYGVQQDCASSATEQFTFWAAVIALAGIGIYGLLLLGDVIKEMQKQ